MILALLSPFAVNCVTKCFVNWCCCRLDDDCDFICCYDLWHNYCGITIFSTQCETECFVKWYRRRPAPNNNSTTSNNKWSYYPNISWPMQDSHSSEKLILKYILYMFWTINLEFIHQVHECRGTVLDQAFWYPLLVTSHCWIKSFSVDHIMVLDEPLRNKSKTALSPFTIRSSGYPSFLAENLIDKLDWLPGP